MAAPNGSEYFEALQEFKVKYAPIHFSEYASTRTGMRVVVVKRQGPKIVGYFTLATEIHDDSGAPHTLEHLVFMGSRSFQYKGLLDKLATRAFSYTNAWTATDHTNYQLETAGWEGFAQILPVYLEHLLMPTLSDAACYTEVHHVDGSGHDAGVVYSEMQGRQNQQGDLMMLQAKRLLYPETIGFRYETGGMMEQLRILTADRIRNFHREMYQPKNLCVVVMGEVDSHDVLNILGKFEDSIIDSVPRLDEPFDRPWSKFGKTPSLSKSLVEIVEFPEDDETTGEVLIGMIGPDCNDATAMAALNVLLYYICGSSVSILENTLVEKEQVASSVYQSLESRPDTVIWFQLAGVESQNLESTEKRFFEVLTDTSSRPLDMEYLTDCLHRHVRQLKNYAETCNSAFGERIITDHLFGKRDGSTLRDIPSLDSYETVSNWTEREWHTALDAWFINAKHVSILGKPSRKLSQKIKDDEKARVKAQQERFGEGGLKELQQKLDAAKAENDREIPEQLLRSFDVPGTDSIHFIPSTTARFGFAKQKEDLDNPIQRIIDQNSSTTPLFLHFEHIETNFVQIALIINTHTVPVMLRPLLSVYIDNFFNTPIIRNGARIDFEDVVSQLERDTVTYGIEDAGDFGNPEPLLLRLQVEPAKYAAAVSWIKDLLVDSVFDPIRLKSSLVKLLADIPEEKRDGYSMATSAMMMLYNTRESSHRAQDTLVKAVYLKRILQLLDENPEKLVYDLETVRGALVQPGNIRVLVIADLQNGDVINPVSTWETLVQTAEPDSLRLSPLDSSRTCLTDAGKRPGELAYIIPMSTIDSSYASIVGKGVDSYDHPLLPALTVALGYLEATEGPLWTAVRGTGLAYGVWFSRNIQQGSLKFEIYRSPDAYKAFATSRKTVEDLATGKVELDSLALEGAVSSVVVALADGQPTADTAATASFINQVVKSVDKYWGLELIKQVRKVTKGEVKKVLNELILPIFKPASGNIVVTCSDIMQEHIMKDFESEGFSPQVKPLAFFYDTYDLEGADVLRDALNDELEEEEEDGDYDEEGIDEDSVDEGDAED